MKFNRYVVFDEVIFGENAVNIGQNYHDIVKIEGFPDFRVE